MRIDVERVDRRRLWHDANLQALTDMPPFNAVTDEEIRRFIAIARSVTFTRNELVCGPDDPRDTVFVVCTGVVRLYRISRAGKELTVTLVFPGQVFRAGVIDSLQGDGGFGEAMTDRVGLYRIAASELVALELDHRMLTARLEQAMQELTAELLRQACDLAEDLAFEPVGVRLAHVLERLVAGRSGQHVTATHAELAGMVGTTPEQVTKRLHEFRDLGLVRSRYHRHGIVVPDPARLQQYAER